MRYEVDADLYEGPLPLLVELAKLGLIDIFLIKLVRLTAAYLQEVRSLEHDPSICLPRRMALRSAGPAEVAEGSAQRRGSTGLATIASEPVDSAAPRSGRVLGSSGDERSGSRDRGTGRPVGLYLNELAEPLPLLGSLMVAKARGLLPQAPQPEEAEEESVSLEELERRLKEYEQFKTVAQLLAELHALQHQHFTRREPEESPAQPSGSSASPFEVSLADLMGAFSEVLGRATAPVYEVQAEVWTVEAKVRELRMLLAIKRQVRFLDLFTAEKSKLELVVTFLALLELMRQWDVRAVQERPFGEIVIVRCGRLPQADERQKSEVGWGAEASVAAAAPAEDAASRPRAARGRGQESGRTEQGVTDG